MMTFLQYAACAAIGYLFGCSNMAHYLAHFRGVDLRAGGSGNLGASNAMILMGWRAGILTALHDIAKSVCAVLIAKLLFPSLLFAGAAAGAASVLGHIFPFYLRFRGGKGLAPYIGMVAALNWRFFLILIAAMVIITIVTDYIFFATCTAIATFPVFTALTQGWLMAAFCTAASLVVLYKHRENFVRLARGEEIGLRAANSGKHRAKNEKTTK